MKFLPGSPKYKKAMAAKKRSPKKKKAKAKKAKASRKWKAGLKHSERVMKKNANRIIDEMIRQGLLKN